MIKGLRLLFLFMFIVPMAKGQGSCAEILNNARQQFESGHLYEIPALVKPCLDNGFNKTQKIQAYLLLTQTYLFIDDPISAEDSYLKLLKLDPEYRNDPERDPIDVVYLSKKFKTTPIFQLFVKAGLNYSQVDVINNYGVDNTAMTYEDYTGNLGFQIGTGSELNLNDDLSIGMELLLDNKSYSYSNTLFDNDQQTFEEKRWGLTMPLFFKYRFDFPNTQPYAYVGSAFDFLISANTLVRLTDNRNDNTTSVVDGPKLDITRQRQFSNWSVLFGGGINYKIGYNYLSFDIRAVVGLTNIVDVDHQFDNNELVFRYGYVDDDKRINNVIFSIGFVKPLYLPRRIEDQGTKNIFSRIFKKNDQ